jgi:solute carrier family 27 (fatty acid transporter), member 1/4
MENYSSRIANLFQEKFKLKKGDVIALFMENKPEFVGIWYGLSKIGVISSLVNTNLREDVLIYSIKKVNPKVVIYGSELTEGTN